MSDHGLWAFARLQGQPQEVSIRLRGDCVSVILRDIVLNIRLKERNLFLPAQPVCHLRDLIPEVRGSPTLLGHVNVEPLEHFCIVIISGTKIFDQLHVVDHGVELGDI